MLPNPSIQVIDNEKVQMDALTDRRGKRHRNLRRSAAVDDHLTIGLQEGDILLNADGTPAYSETAVSAYLQSCSSADAALIVYRPSVADVVTIR